MSTSLYPVVHAAYVERGSTSHLLRGDASSARVEVAQKDGQTSVFRYDYVQVGGGETVFYERLLADAVTAECTAAAAGTAGMGPRGLMVLLCGSWKTDALRCFHSLASSLVFQVAHALPPGHVMRYSARRIYSWGVTDALGGGPAEHALRGHVEGFPSPSEPLLTRRTLGSCGPDEMDGLGRTLRDVCTFPEGHGIVHFQLEVAPRGGVSETGSCLRFTVGLLPPLHYTNRHLRADLCTLRQALTGPLRAPPSRLLNILTQGDARGRVFLAAVVSAAVSPVTDVLPMCWFACRPAAGEDRFPGVDRGDSCSLEKTPASASPPLNGLPLKLLWSHSASRSPCSAPSHWNSMVDLSPVPRGDDGSSLLFPEGRFCGGRTPPLPCDGASDCPARGAGADAGTHVRPALMASEERREDGSPADASSWDPWMGSNPVRRADRVAGETCAGGAPFAGLGGGAARAVANKAWCQGQCVSMQRETESALGEETRSLAETRDRLRQEVACLQSDVHALRELKAGLEKSVSEMLVHTHSALDELVEQEEMTLTSMQKAATLLRFAESSASAKEASLVAHVATVAKAYEQIAPP